MRYREWKLINESLAGGFGALGLTNPQTLGGPVGSNLREMDDDLLDDEDDEMEDEDDETDLFGDEEMDPDMDFPPDESEEMDGLPTPDEEMMDDEDMLGDDDESGDMDFLNDIDPELAGLDDDEAGLGDEMLDGDEEEADMDDMDMLGDDGDMDDMGGLGDDEDDMDMLGDEDMDILNADEEDMDMDDMDVEVGDDLEGGEEGEYGEFMNRMADYCGRYMADHMVKRSRKFMHKDGGKKSGKKIKDDGIHSREDMTDMAANHFGKKKDKCESVSVRRESVGTYEETEDQFFATLRNSAKGDHNIQGWSGLTEDMLLQMKNDPGANFAPEPEAGQAGFAPQGRVGEIGGGYTQDDFADLPTMTY